MSKGKPKWVVPRPRAWYDPQCYANPLGRDHAYAGKNGMFCIWCYKVKKGYTLPKDLRETD